MSFLFFQAEKQILDEKMDHEYAGIIGVPEFCKKAAELAFGEDSEVIKEGRVNNFQSTKQVRYCQIEIVAQR